VLLQPDAIIDVGQTRLQFKRLGGPTQPVQEDSPGPGMPSAIPSPSPDLAQWHSQPPAQSSSPYAPTDSPQEPLPGQRGGPTKIVRDDE
jgi:hypothetical protein